mgnify:CR=1 FL=1
MGKKLIKSPVYLSKMSNLAFYQLTNSTFKIFAKEKKKRKKTSNSLSKGSIYHKTLNFGSKIGRSH